MGSILSNWKKSLNVKYYLASRAGNTGCHALLWEQSLEIKIDFDRQCDEVGIVISPRVMTLGQKPEDLASLPGVITGWLCDYAQVILNLHLLVSDYF